MYKWPQGRLIRTIGFILAVLIVADLAYNGGYGRFKAYQDATEAAAGTRQLILSVIFGAMAALAAAGVVVDVARLRADHHHVFALLFSHDAFLKRTEMGDGNPT